MIEEYICLPAQLKENENSICRNHQAFLKTLPTDKKNRILIAREMKEAIRLTIQVTEMLSWTNYLFTQIAYGVECPTCLQLSMHYMGKEATLVKKGEKAIVDENSGSYKFRVKWPRIWRSILNCRVKAEKLLNRQATYADLYYYFRDNDGLVRFWQKHPKDLFSNKEETLAKC